VPTAAVADDKRLRVLDVAMKRHQFRADALIEVLHRAQDLFGYLDRDVLRHVARGLKVPPSRVFGVATFYHLFTLKPQGDHACVVCTGTACFVKGAGRLLEAVAQEYGIEPGQTTPDRRLSLVQARCIGACGIAPAVVYDRVTEGKQTPEAVLRRLKELVHDGPH
jgi:bidirectional [NiFe] hydrogenase diaphorase subunit